MKFEINERVMHTVKEHKTSGSTKNTRAYTTYHENRATIIEVRKVQYKIRFDNGITKMVYPERLSKLAGE